MTRFDGRDEAMKDLRKLRDRIAETFSGEVSSAELFPPEFIQRHTSHDSCEAFFASHGINDISAAPESDLDAVVAAHTDFSSWDQMMQTALAQYGTRKGL